MVRLCKESEKISYAASDILAQICTTEEEVMALQEHLPTCEACIVNFRYLVEQIMQGELTGDRRIFNPEMVNAVRQVPR